MKLIIKRCPPNTSQYAPDTPPPDAQINVCERATYANYILIKKKCMLLIWDGQRHQKVHMHSNKDITFIFMHERFTTI